MSNAHTTVMPASVVVHRSTVLDAPADWVWQAVRTPAAFRLVTRGLVRVVGLRRRATPWREGEHGRMVLEPSPADPAQTHGGQR